VGAFTFTSSTCAYEGPGKIPEGEVSFSLLSEGGPADFDLYRFDGGHTYDELVAHTAEEMRRAEEGLPGLGHPDFATLVAEASTDGEGHGTMTTTVDAGEYGMACIRFEGDRAIVAAGPFAVEPEA
jgi:hypothetical protein